MAIYELTKNYRGINKAKNGEECKYPKFYTFKKGDMVEAEPYNPSGVEGVKFAKMMLVSGYFIVPTNALKEKNENELETSLLKEESKSNEEPKTEEEAIKVDEVESEKAKSIASFSVKSLKENSKNIGKAAMFGGVAGFGISYFMKKNLWSGTIVGVLVGVTAIIVANNYKSTTTEETEKPTTNE
jgi:hypothetical protein